MKNNIRGRLGDARGNATGIFEHQLPIGEVRGLGKNIAPPPLQGGVVVGRESIDAEYGVTICEQASCQMKTDKASSASHQNAHGFTNMKRYDSTAWLLKPGTAVPNTWKAASRSSVAIACSSMWSQPRIDSID